MIDAVLKPNARRDLVQSLYEAGFTISDIMRETGGEFRDIQKMVGREPQKLTQRLRASILARLAAGETAEDISESVGRSPVSIKNIARNEEKALAGALPPRKCLCCHAEFQPTDKVYRMCMVCREVASNSVTTYSLGRY